MKKISSQEALTRLQKLCSHQEKCSSDIQVKLNSWGIDENDTQKILVELKREKFLDDKRFAEFFVKEKQNINKWGKEKIKFALIKKRIDKEIIDGVLSEINQENQMIVLKGLLIKKKGEIKSANPYEIKRKLINFGLQRGFGIDNIYTLVDEILKG